MHYLIHIKSLANLYIIELARFYFFGAGSGNRTHATRSEALHSTTKLYPHFFYYNIFIDTMSSYIKKEILMDFFFSYLLTFSFFNKSLISSNNRTSSDFAGASSTSSFLFFLVILDINFTNINMHKEIIKKSITC